VKEQGRCSTKEHRLVYQVNEDNLTGTMD